MLLSSRLSRALEYILKIPLHFPNLQILYNTNDSCGEVAVLKEQNKSRNQNEIFETKGAQKYIWNPTHSFSDLEDLDCPSKH